MSRDMCRHGFDLRTQGEDDYPLCVDCATPDQLRARLLIVEEARSSEADGGSVWRQSALEMERLGASLATEREACAQAVEAELAILMGPPTSIMQLGSIRSRIKGLAAAIRARGAE